MLKGQTQKKTRTLLSCDPAGLSRTESRIANRTIPRIACLESPELLQQEAQK